MEFLKTNKKELQANKKSFERHIKQQKTKEKLWSKFGV